MAQKNRSFFWALIPLWGVLVLWNLFTPAQEFSEAENRYLAAFPAYSHETLLDGRFMDKVNDYLNDQFVGRPYWVSAQSLLEYGMGKREINGVYLGKNALFTRQVPPDGRFSGQNIAGVNAFARSSGIPAYVMLVPSAAVVEPDKLPDRAQAWDEAAFIQEVYGQLDPGITTIDAYGLLRAQEGGDPLYYRTDHHWTTYGASLAAEALRVSMGVGPLDAAALTRETVSQDFLGTLHSKTGFPLVAADSMERYQQGAATAYEIFDGKTTTRYDSIYFPEFLEKKDKYSYFLGQVQPAVTIFTEATDKGRLLVFKDSYAHSLAPMLLDSFSEIKLVDLRYFNAAGLQEQLGEEQYDQVLFLYSADVFAHQLGTGKLA